LAARVAIVFGTVLKFTFRSKMATNEANATSASFSNKVPENKTKTLLCNQGAVRAVRFNIDGEYCLTCGSDKSVKLWNPHKALHLQTYSGHASEVLDASGSHDSSHIVSCGMDRSVYLWDVSSAQAVRRYRAHAAQVNCVVFNQESTIILSASLDGTLKAWDCKSRSRDPVQVFDDAKDSITSIYVTNFEIVTSSLDAKVRKYDLRKGLLDVDDCSASATNVCLSKDGQCILVGCLDSCIRLLDKDTGELLNVYKGHTNKKYKIESHFVNNDSHIVSGSEDGKLYIWDLIKCTLKATIIHENHRVVHSVSVHPTKNEILTAAEGTVYLWTDIKEE
ncbi:WD repeat domain-containing protein 83-like protein, partial [Dinothrombium tinctorium]